MSLPSGVTLAPFAISTLAVETMSISKSTADLPVLDPYCMSWKRFNCWREFVITLSESFHTVFASAMGHQNFTRAKSFPGLGIMTI